MRFAGSSTAMNAMFGGDPARPRYDQMAQVGIQGQSKQRQAAFASDAYAEVSDINAKSLVEQAEAQADAIAAAGQAQGQASMVGGIASGVSSLFGAFG